MYIHRMPKKGVVHSSGIDYNAHSKYNWLYRLRELESDSEDDAASAASAASVAPSAASVASVAPSVAPSAPSVSATTPEAFREWNQKGIPKTLPYNKHPVSRTTPQVTPKDDTWTSIIKTSSPPTLNSPEITYNDTIDNDVSMWSERVVSAFEKASTAPKKSELSEDFKETLGKLSFFRRPLVSKE